MKTTRQMKGPKDYFYYNCFNPRRLMDAAALFSEGQIEFSPGTTWQGPDGYLQFADTWISAFPDVTFGVESVNWRSETVCETYFQRREAASRLGSELDAARKALRPHFRW